MKGILTTCIFCVITSACAAQTAWQFVGKQQFTPGYAGNPDLEISDSGTPYVSFQDASIGNKAAVMKFNGTKWVFEGVDGFSSGIANNLHLASDKYDSLYVSYSNASDSSVEIRKFNGVTWLPVGVFKDKSYHTNIALDFSGTPFVVTVHPHTINDTVIVSHFTGGQWLANKFIASGIVGSGGGGPPGTENPLIRITRSGTPYVAYGFEVNPGQTGMEIKKYVSPNWVTSFSDSWSTPNAMRVNTRDSVFTEYTESYMNSYENTVVAGNKAIYNSGYVPTFVDMDLDTASNMYMLGSGLVYLTIHPAHDSLNGSVIQGPYINGNYTAKIAIDKSNKVSCNTIYLAYQDTGTNQLSVVSLKGPLGIKAIQQEENSISVFPNPNNGMFEISIELSKTDNYTIELLNSLGQQIYSEKKEAFSGHYSKSMDLHTTSPGIYYLVVKGRVDQVVRKVILY
jgi:hypothetical protein